MEMSNVVQAFNVHVEGDCMRSQLWCMHEPYLVSLKLTKQVFAIGSEGVAHGLRGVEVSIKAPGRSGVLIYK